MGTQQNSVLPANDGYFTFMSRITGLWLLLVFITLWIIGELPHQLPVNDTDWFPSVLVSQLASILLSTLTIFFLIIPSRKMAVICLLAMVFLLISYQGRNQALTLSIFPLIYLPFVVRTAEFGNAWKWTGRLMLVSFIVLIPVTSVSFTAIPVYTLLIHAFIPWKQVFVRFVERFEPK
ncbi:MAG: hypothetical protein ACOYVG_03160 [Bacteroidota bacterium]